MNKQFEEFQVMGKENLDAIISGATAASKGFQEIATESVEFSRKSFEKGNAAVETLMGAKTFEKVIEAQQEIARSAYEDFIGQMTKIGEIYTRTAKEAFKPVEAQIAGLTKAASKQTAGKKATAK